MHSLRCIYGGYTATPILMWGWGAFLHCCIQYKALRRSRYLLMLELTARRAIARPVEIRKPLPTKNLLEDTDGLLRPPPPFATPIDAIACCSRFLLTCALLMTSSLSEGPDDCRCHR